MTLDFQQELLQFLVQKKEAKKYLDILDSGLFDIDSSQIVYDLLKGYVADYKVQPTRAGLLEYFSAEIKKKEFNGEDLSEVKTEVRHHINKTYKEFNGNIVQIKDTIISLYQLKLLRKLFVEKAAKIKNSDSAIVLEVFKEVSRIKKIGEEDLEESEGKFALKDYVKGRKTKEAGAATYLKELNNMTAVGGFYSPQLIMFSGLPKSFKTGLMLNIAMNYVRDGYKVFYVDCENGIDRILDRYYQCMLKATWKEYTGGTLDDVLEKIVKRHTAMKADFRVGYYPANTKSTADVEGDLLDLQTDYEWVPDLIIYDYADLLKPEDYKITEKRFKIQAIYHDIIRLNNKYKLFAITLSQLSKSAYDSEVVNETNFAEDFGKAANCHAAFGLNRTKEEKIAKVMRISPILQREGVSADSGKACFVQIDYERMSVTEITKEQWKEAVDKVVLPAIMKKKRRRTRGINNNVKDD